jgi:hypothetical protein
MSNNIDTYSDYQLYELCFGMPVLIRANVIDSIETIIETAYSFTPINSFFELCAGTCQNLDILRLTRLSKIPYLGSDIKEFELIPKHRREGQLENLFGIDIMQSLEHVPVDSTVIIFFNALSITFLNLNKDDFDNKIKRIIDTLYKKNCNIIIHELPDDGQSYTRKLYNYPNEFEAKYETIKLKNNHIEVRCHLKEKQRSLSFTRYQPDDNSKLFELLEPQFYVTCYDVDTLKTKRKGSKRVHELYFCIPKQL